MQINYVTGDATAPIGQGSKIIVHVCNDVGGWGRGFVVAISKRWPEPEERYRAWYRGAEALAFELGAVQFVQVKPEISVANLIGQRDVRPIQNIPPVRYEAIRTGLQSVANEAHRLKASVHMPRMGCGLAGGQWAEVEKIVQQELGDKGVPVTVYDLAG